MYIDYHRGKRIPYLNPDSNGGKERREGNKKKPRNWTAMKKKQKKKTNKNQLFIR